jgi:hypothetical protein
MEKVDKERLLDRLSKLIDEVFSFKHQKGITMAKQDHKEDVLLQHLHML